MKKLVWIIAPLVITVMVISALSKSEHSYQEEFEHYWADKHDFFEHSEASPFVQQGKPYEQCVVYPFDPAYRVNARLKRYSSREIVQIGNSDGTTTSYLKFADAIFKIEGNQQKLLILKALGFGGMYLTAFGDETSGDSTYGGGRYLDLDIGKSDKLVIDFNKAYNPYCAYFEDYECPLPPSENLLSIPIKAGEKNYPH